MHKCNKCGTQFEGNVCPNCGFVGEGRKRCPHCGAIVASASKFCNGCGYSFENKSVPTTAKQQSAAVVWVKKHKVALIISSIVLVVAIVLLSLIPTFIKASVNGTYYQYFPEINEINKERYITLNTGKWAEEGGNGGRYEVKGNTVTLYSELFGEEMEFLSGTVKNGVFKIEGIGGGVYITKNHKHSFGNWATNATDDTRYHICSKCGGKETETAEKFLAYKLDAKTNTYYVSGIEREFAKGKLIIPEKYNNRSVTSISNYAFRNCSGLTSITLPDSVTSIGDSAFYGCSKLSSITLPDSVTSIGDGVFWNCSGLTSITIGNSVTSIGWDAFRNCSGLTSITIPDSVTSISNYAFRNCSGLTSITIPDSVTSIGDDAFWNCSGLTSIIIGNSVTSIGDYVFGNCSGLTSITIPSSVTYISRFAFYRCDELTSITFKGTRAQWTAIEKADGWEPDTRNYTVQCTDGKLDSNGYEIE